LGVFSIALIEDIIVKRLLKKTFAFLIIITIIGSLFFKSFSGMRIFKYHSPYLPTPVLQKIKKSILTFKKKSNHIKVSFFGRGLELFFVNFCSSNNITLIHDLPAKLEPHSKVDLKILILRP
jgi:hypothetical protein